MNLKPRETTSPGGAWETFHPQSAPDGAAIAQLRAMVAPNKGKLRGTAARVPFDGIISHTSFPEGVGFREDTIGDVPGWWCEPTAARQDAAILHLHGGWFNWGKAQAFRNLVGHIARSAGARAFIPDYRLAPEHPFPAAVDDAQACFRGLVETGVRNIALTGDSAGGNLALVLLALTGGRSGVRAVGAVALSPVTDLALTGASWESRADADPFFRRDQAESLIAAYIGGHSPVDPSTSPLYGSFAGLPPIRIHVGDAEVLLDDSRRYAAAAVAAGVDARVDVWEGMPHGFIGNIGQLEAAAKALDMIGNFVSERLDAGAPAKRAGS